MGFDTECVIDINACPREYFCPVCHTLVYPDEALQSQCCHLYCKPCLTYIANSSRACPSDGYLVAESASKGAYQAQHALVTAQSQVQLYPQVFAKPSAPNHQGNPQQPLHPAMHPHTQIQLHTVPPYGETTSSQFHGQVVQQHDIMRPSQFQAPMTQEQPSTLVFSLDQVPGIPPAQQPQVLPNTQQQACLVYRRPVIQPFQQYLPQQCALHQPFLAPIQIQLHQLGRIPLEKPLWPQVCPYGPFHMMQQNMEAPPAWLPRQSQNYDGRLVMPAQCIQSKPFTQSSVCFGSTAQVRPMQLGMSQPYTDQSYSKSTVLKKIGDPVSEKFGAAREVGSSSQQMSEKDSNVIGSDTVDVNYLKSETIMNIGQDQKLKAAVEPTRPLY
ncbi:chromatin modification-related protein eaf-1-like [Forsythia ovata]|uniref:Chromatin modification-related protein eaf-1-like n=1 Tax=Forsythia ovata TaxID=205694 RepID=A0ABD1T6K5_9LAMI